jgi:serralysin
MNDQLSSIEGVIGSSGQDTIRGSSGYNELFGFGGDDKVSGGDGKDQVSGGASADSMSGGAHADKFIYKSLGDSTAAVHDTLVDFSHAQKDKIDLSDIDANPNKSGNQGFAFIGDDGFTDPGQVHYLHVGSSTVVQVNTDNDTTAEMEIWVSGGPDLVKSDFVL